MNEIISSIGIPSSKAKPKTPFAKKKISYDAGVGSEYNSAFEPNKAILYIYFFK